MIKELPKIKLDLQGHLDNLYCRKKPNRPFFFEHGLEPGTKNEKRYWDICEEAHRI